MTEDSSADLDFFGALQRLGESEPGKAAEKVKEQLQNLHDVTLNIAVIGETGAGKSTFINAFQGLGEDDETSAPTGITETTKDPTMYTLPTEPKVTLWDLPGIGSPNFKANKYLKEVKFEMYDFFIIISSERFKENDIFLAKEIKKKKKSFYFVRTKIDNDIRAASHTRKFNEQQVLSTIREDCHKNLKDVGDPKVFLISSYDFEKYDFQNLVDTLESELPEHKRFALVHSLPVYSLAVLEKKKIKLGKYIWLAAVASALGTFVPAPVVSVLTDKAILVAFIISCHYALGLGEKSLKKLSEKVNKPVSELKSAIKSPLALAVIDKLSVMPRTTRPPKSLDELLDSTRVHERIQTASVAFKTTYTLLSQGLDEMSNDMKQVLQTAGLD